MHYGSCLCGKIQYQYDGVIDEISRCHCLQCQKASGTAFVAVTPVESASLTFTEGLSLVKEFRASEGKVRAFCSECGSPLYSARDDIPEIKRLRLGTLDTKLVTDNQFHAFVSSEASWYKIFDTYPQYPYLPK